MWGGGGGGGRRGEVRGSLCLIKAMLRIRTVSVYLDPGPEGKQDNKTIKKISCLKELDIPGFCKSTMDLKKFSKFFFSQF